MLLLIKSKARERTVCQGEIEKMSMADHIWKEKGNHQPLWDEVKIIGREQHWKIRHLKEAAHVRVQ